MRTSENISNLAAALVAAQGELTNPPKDAKANLGAGGSYSYTELSTLCAHVRPVLAKHGLGYVQPPISRDGEAGCETILMHSSGEFIAEEYTMPVPGKFIKGAVRDPGPHEYGSVLSYCRRYSLQALLGIVGEQDDDGNIAQNAHREQFEELKQTNSDNEKRIKGRDRYIAAMAEYRDAINAMHDAAAADQPEACVAAMSEIPDEIFSLLNSREEGGAFDPELRAFLKGSKVKKCLADIATAAAT